jgi:Protein of unknown function (DUF4031)
MVYVDNACIKKFGYLWCHLIADDILELHEFAETIRVNSNAFHLGAKYPHYDITASQRFIALRNGAHPITSKAAVRIAKTTCIHESEKKQYPLFV